MAHPLYWPGKYYSYPIGNTSAICLTRDIAPEEQADILLLGCGDPRNVLYTVFCEPRHFNRKLDFTCCDMEPAMLARNALLFSLITDQQKHTTIWNIFFHMYLDKDSHSVLVDQCNKLVSFSGDLRKWHASPYGRSIRMCTEYTLRELQRHWQRYIDMQHLPAERLKAIRAAFNKNFHSEREIGVVFSSARSSGPLTGQAMEVFSIQFNKYRKSGVTFSNPGQVAAATVLNPTFVYSLAGEGCNVHYGTDPLIPFHFAALFGNSKKPVTVATIVESAKSQFGDWCTAFHESISLPISTPPVIRFFLGEATAVCRVLRSFATTGALKLGIPVAQWKTQLMELGKDEYLNEGGAPVYFNVIDSSNLDDHLGLLNVLVSAAPLLSTSSPSSVLYTESLLTREQDATKEFAERLYGDITTVGLLLGICPMDYLSGFTTRSNSHEIIMNQVIKGVSPQFHQVSTWKSPVGGDATARGVCQTLVFDSYQLGTFLYDMYHQLFEQEDARNFWALNRQNILKSVAFANIVHYIRETFVIFLKFIRERMNVSEGRWSEIMERFFDLQERDTSMPMDSNNANDLYANMIRHGVYVFTPYRSPGAKIGRFSSWNEVPAIVRIVFTIPREKLAVLNVTGTPPLQCDVRGNWCHNIFASVHVAYGRAIPMGTKSNPSVLFEEDPEGWKGSSPLVASFIMPSRLLTDIEPPQNLRICFSVKSSPGTVMEFIPKIGHDLIISQAKFMDESSVHVLPEQPLPSKRPQPPSPVTSGLLTQIGDVGATVVELDEECELVASLTSRVTVTDEEAKRLFESGTTPEIKQTSPCVMRINLENRTQDVAYPWPVIGSQYKLRLARKSLYIEVVVRVFVPLKPDGMKLNLFPVIGSNKILSPWNIHHVNLSRLPVLNTKLPSKNIYKWLNPHVGSAMSTRERSLRKKREEDALMFVKETLHAIFVRSSGIQGGPARRLFALRDEVTNNCDTVFFINDLRFDLSSHTMVCDAYVLPLTHALMPMIEGPFTKLVTGEDVVSVTVFKGEMETWKQLLPAFVERCRTWKHGDNCEYISQGKIPLTKEMEEDPLCSCGRGKDIEDMHKVALWSKLAPYVTRLALSPLFAVTYLEPIGRDPAARRCYVCRGKGKPKLMTCTQCKKVRYCSQECQKKDWKIHKTRCKP